MSRANRRRFLSGSAALVGTALLAGCDSSGATPWVRRILDKDEDANLFVQRLLQSDQRLAREYTAAELSPRFKANGTEDPADDDYKAMVQTGFSTFELEIGGLVERPERLSLAVLRALPSRTQITRHDCVEGWSCIGQWTGVPLSTLLRRVGLKPQARFVVFHCADTMDGGSAGLDAADGSGGLESLSLGGLDGDAGSGGDAKHTMTPGDDAAKQPDTGGKAKGDDAKKVDSKASADVVGGRYYESIDLVDAFHPQTILAYAMNGAPLPVAHGAPLRLRVERQLGYKMAKYVLRLAIVADLASIGQGGGGYWEDNGYEWYAGI